MKYHIKKARGHFRIVRSIQGNIWRYTILGSVTSIARITYLPVRTFAFLVIENRIFGGWKPRPAFLPRFVRRCA